MMDIPDLKEYKDSIKTIDKCLDNLTSDVEKRLSEIQGNKVSGHQIIDSNLYLTTLLQKISPLEKKSEYKVSKLMKVLQDLEYLEQKTSLAANDFEPLYAGPNLDNFVEEEEQEKTGPNLDSSDHEVEKNKESFVEDLYNQMDEKPTVEKLESFAFGSFDEDFKSTSKKNKKTDFELVDEFEALEDLYMEGDEKPSKSHKKKKTKKGKK